MKFPLLQLACISSEEILYGNHLLRGRKHYSEGKRSLQDRIVHASISNICDDPMVPIRNQLVHGSWHRRATIRCWPMRAKDPGDMKWRALRTTRPESPWIAWGTTPRLWRVTGNFSRYAGEKSIGDTPPPPLHLALFHSVLRRLGATAHCFDSVCPGPTSVIHALGQPADRLDMLNWGETRTRFPERAVTEVGIGVHRRATLASVDLARHHIVAMGMLGDGISTFCDMVATELCMYSESASMCACVVVSPLSR